MQLTCASAAYSIVKLNPSLASSGKSFANPTTLRLKAPPSAFGLHNCTKQGNPKRNRGISGGNARQQGITVYAGPLDPLIRSVQVIKCPYLQGKVCVDIDLGYALWPRCSVVVHQPAATTLRVVCHLGHLHEFASNNRQISMTFACDHQPARWFPGRLASFVAILFSSASSGALVSCLRSRTSTAVCGGGYNICHNRM